MHFFFYELKYSIAQLERRKLLAVVVIVSLAVGVSCNALVFSWVEKFLLNPFPAVESVDQLRFITTKTASGEFVDSSYLDYKDHRDSGDELARMIAYKSRGVSLRTVDDVRKVETVFASKNYFSSLELSPFSGRFFSVEDFPESDSGGRVAVISHGFWRRSMASDKTVLGKSLILNGIGYSIIGVAPERFHGTDIAALTDIWLPIGALKAVGGLQGWQQDREHRTLKVMLRLGSDLREQRVNERIKTVSALLSNDFPGSNKGHSFHTYKIGGSPQGGAADASVLLVILFVSSILLLIIISSNLINLLMIKAVEREKELAIRFSVGARKIDILRLFFIDGLVVATLSAVLSLVFLSIQGGLIARFLDGVDVSLAPDLIGRPELFIYTFVVSFIAGISISVISCLRSLRIQLASTLQDGMRGTSQGKTLKNVRTFLIGSQVSLAFITLSFSAAFLQSFSRLSQIDPGFRVENIDLIGVSTINGNEPTAELTTMLSDVQQQVVAIAGVDGAAFAEYVPLGGVGGSWEEISIDGYSPQIHENMKVHRNFVSDDYFAVMAIDRLRGRLFRKQDLQNSNKVVVINETFASRFFQAKDPVGRTIYGWGAPLEIVGVVDDSKYDSLAESNKPYFYLPFGAFTSSQDVVLHIKHSGVNRNSLIARVRSVFESSNSRVFMSWDLPLEKYVERSMFAQKFSSTILSFLGAVSLLLASFGIYGIVHQAIIQRRLEIGIRMAIGASSISIMKMLVFHNMKIILSGLLVGLLALVYIWSNISRLLYGSSSISILAISSVSLLLVLVSLMAVLLPSVATGKMLPADILRR